MKARYSMSFDSVALRPKHYYKDLLAIVAKDEGIQSNSKLLCHIIREHFILKYGKEEFEKIRMAALERAGWW